MSPARFLLLLLLLGGAHLPATAQTTLRGTVFDADTRQPLPRVSIRLVPRPGIVGGSSSGPDGSFRLLLPAAPDTLTLSCIGYAPVAVLTAGLRSPQPFYLRRQPVQLGAVTVASPLTERRFGITSARALLHFTDGTVAAGQPVEIAQLIRLGTTAATLTSVSLYLAATTADSLSAEVRFYGFDGQRPTRQLTSRVVRRRVAVRAGWLRLELPPGLLMQCPPTFVLGLTLRPDSAARQPIPYEIKLGGPAKSFVRPPADSSWRVPPHHYRLHVTALVPTSTPHRGAEADNQETAATTHLYSAAVPDSFSLFVRLPAGYARHPRRRYPLVLLLDANAYFDQVADAIGQLPPAEQPLLVGLGYRDVYLMDSLRQRDYLYPAAPPADSLPVAGGGQRFLAFIGQELLPYLDQQYRIQPAGRTLMGHSFGGYFVLYALLHELPATPPAFHRYVAASPALYYADQYLLRELAAAPPAAPGRALQLSVGELELRPTDAEGAATRAAFEQLLRELATRHPALTVEATRYPGAAHLETAVPAFTDAVKSR